MAKKDIKDDERRGIVKDVEVLSNMNKNIATEDIEKKSVDGDIDNKVDVDVPSNPNVIAENVAKGMKKTAEKSVSKSVKTTKKSTTTKKTTKKINE